MAPGGVLAPFGFPAFRAIWIANLVSNIGSMVQSLATAWLMTTLTESLVLIAMVQTALTLPVMLFGVVAGAIADNFDRRLVMLVAQFGMLIASTCLLAVTIKDMASPATLLGLTVLVGIGTAMNAPAWQASVRAQVGPKDLPQAISLNSIAFNLARSAGPALGGLLISLWNVSIAFACNAVSYVFLIIVLLRWRPKLPRPARAPIWRSIQEGARFCILSAPVRRVLLRGLSVGIGFASFHALLPVIVRDQLLGTEIEFGVLLSSFGLASIMGALLVSPIRRRWASETVIGFGTVLFAIALLAVAASSTLALAVTAALIAGFGWVTTLTTLNVSMQLRSPDEALGRCLSIYQAVTFGGMAIGAWTWGAIAEALDIRAALVCAATWLTLSHVILKIFAPSPLRGEGGYYDPD